MGKTDGLKRVLRFGNLEDVIFTKNAGLEILQDKIRELNIELAEYDDAGGAAGSASEDDPYVKEIYAKIDSLRAEQELIRSDIFSIETELALQKCAAQWPW